MATEKAVLPIEYKLLVERIKLHYENEISLADKIMPNYSNHGPGSAHHERWLFHKALKEHAVVMLAMINQYLGK